MDEKLKETVYELMNLKYDQARNLDLNWNYNNYIWVLGFKALRALEAQGCIITRQIKYEGHIYLAKFLWGIEIDHVDNNHPDRVSLYKEVT